MDAFTRAASGDGDLKRQVILNVTAAVFATEASGYMGKDGTEQASVFAQLLNRLKS